MMIRNRRTASTLLVCGIVGALLPQVVLSQETYSASHGVAALRFAAGSIQLSMPQDGIVNLITGDNQTTGNRMALGWNRSDVLYLKLNRPGEATVGDLYTVYRKVHKVFHPRTRIYMGYVVNMLAVVRVIQADERLATVQIVQSFGPLSPGDPVMRYRQPPVIETNTGDRATSDTIDGMVVNLQADKNMSLVGQGNVVYLDQGRAEGIHSGDHLEIDRLGSGLPRRKIAEVTVLSAEDHTATALIVRSSSRVLVGDRVRQRPHSAEALLSNNGPSWMDGSRTISPAPLTRPNVQLNTRLIYGTAHINLDELTDQLEYESGEVKIKPAGAPILARIADFLKTTDPDKSIRVEGHADNMEIGPSLKLVFASNWELSRARADGILRYLVEKGGLDSGRLTAVGYGATRPVASNATEEGRKHNRRVEIVLYTTTPPQAADVITNGPTSQLEPPMDQSHSVMSE